MAQIRYRKYRIYIMMGVAVLLYFFLRSRQYNFRLEFDVNKTSPSTVWEFAADFGNMKRLNPTILDFTIESESGNYDHWEYTTHYTEYLSQLPSITHQAKAHFIVRPEGKDFVILSQHSTCFLPVSFACVNSKSEFRFSAGSFIGSTTCIEDVTYECPAIFSGFCAREVAFQRYAIRDNMRKHFASAIRM